MFIFAFESAITLTAESAIILGESIFGEWRSLFDEEGRSLIAVLT